MNSNCGDLVNSGARVNTEVLNRLAELREKVANQHWSNSHSSCFCKTKLNILLFKEKSLAQKQKSEIANYIFGNAQLLQNILITIKHPLNCLY